MSKNVADNRALWCRYELKYRLSESHAALVEEFVRPHLPLDRYSQVQPGRYYPVGGLYLDSRNFQFFRQTKEGIKNRVKLRVRSYTDDPDYPRFLEIKRRLNYIIIKSRTRIHRDDISAVLAGHAPQLHEYITDQDVLKQFQLYMNMINAAPVVQLRYMRRAYEGEEPYRVRVTFDRNLRYNATGKAEVLLDGPAWKRLPLSFVIVEIKFTTCYPAWLSRMTQTLGLQRVSMSKYASTIKQSTALGFHGFPLSVW